MSQKLRVSYKLSPNEEAAVVRSQREERRKARLIQVREQEREAARRAREADRQKREREKKLLQEDIQTHLEASHAAELAAVEERLTSASRHLGLGHRQAEQVQEEESRLHELRLLLAAKQRERARDRHVVALREELSLQQERRGERSRQVERLKFTREEEGKRARESASQSAGHPPIIMDLVAGRGQRVRLQEVEGYSSSYYHLPSCTVQRAASLEGEQPDAQQMADLMAEEMKALDKQSSAVHEEQRELARLRHIHALHKVKMEKERQQLMEQLKTLEREDRALRQKAIAGMPSNMYQPVEQRREVARQQQRDMEQAFERLFLATRGGSSRPNLLQIANPLHPHSPTPTHQEATPTSPTHQEATPTNQETKNGSHLEQSTVNTPDPGSREGVPSSIPTLPPELSVSELTLSEVSPSPQPAPLLSMGSEVRRLVSLVEAQQKAWEATGSSGHQPTPVDSPLPEPPFQSPSPEPAAPARYEESLSVEGAATSLSSLPLETPDLPTSHPSHPHTFSIVPLSALPRPDLSLATEDTGGQLSSLDSCPGESLDTTPTHTTLLLPAETSNESDSSTPASLQEAFLKRKMDFVRQSQRRLQRNARERRSQSPLRELTSDLQCPRPGSSGGKENRRRVVTFSSPVLCSSKTTPLFTPPPEHKVKSAPRLSRGKEKVSVKEMRDRNQRLYSRLPEVRRRRLEEERSAATESNRQRAKAYQQQLRDRLQSKPLKISQTNRKPPFK